ncbi:TetR/AcrR family transcriptional regulator [Moritella viscosa]|uniref:Regulatory protein, TetR n=1 Tax=Moritella viscosa TaxID=80854 RepID=A0A1K9YJL2_9GAMM|nr:TetR/AcrR family transcriptional regulator [Moritella viscosa]SGY81674.1 Regulatory protein, TetR [Moritella viscosa]SGY81806.1 Regulatory protein, TetR [Moritella viscosa]SGY81811.1 Regulatory protein, TetR [Moritella viscosa]SGY81857.1 Regulatory protein, TetR [Moritella viscosa]SGY81988.1 Regulatory protein, TetR [Moritella viscosa]
MTSNQLKPRRGRPPKVPRENSNTRALLIRSGVEVLTESGFAAAGIDGILKKVGVPKGSFYYYFKSKEDFGQAVIDNYANYFAAKLDKCLLDESIAPLQRIVKFADEAKQGIVKFEFKRGCLVGNLGQEVATLPQSYRLVLQDIFTVWQTKMQACLETAQQQGDISLDINCEQQAEYFWIGWEGAVMRARLVQSVQPLNLYIATFIASIATS